MPKVEVSKDGKRKGVQFESRILSSIRKLFPESPVFHNPNIKSTKGFDGVMLKAKKMLSFEVKDTSKTEYYTSRVSKKERDWMDRVDKQGGVSVLITRVKEAGKYIHYMIRWRDIKKEKKISAPVLRKKGAEKFDRVKGKNDYGVKQGIQRILGKGDKDVRKGRVTKRESPGSMKYNEFPEFEDIHDINPIDRPSDFYHMKRHKWKTIIKEGWGIDVDQDGVSENVAIEYKRWSNPYNPKYGTMENYNRLTSRWGKELAKGHNEKMIRKSYGLKGESRYYQKKQDNAFDRLYNEGGIQYKYMKHETPEHYGTVIATMKALKEHGRHAISGQPIDARKHEGARPDIVTVVNGKQVAVEIMSGDKSRGQYRKAFGDKYDKIIFIKRRHVPNPTSPAYERVKQRIWSEIQEQV